MKDGKYDLGNIHRTLWGDGDGPVSQGRKVQYSDDL
jgi:hypothetical protein